MIIPYTYCLTFKPTGQKYYGVRYKRGCKPEDLFQTYFTSSKEIKRLITLYGTQSFETEIRKTFDCAQKARRWEYKVLRRLKVQKNSKWINRKNTAHQAANNHLDVIWIYDPITNKEKYTNIEELEKMILLGYVKGRSPKMKEKVSKSKIGLQSGKNNPMYGRKRADLSARNSLPKKWITDGTNSHQILRNDPIPNGWIAGRTLSYTKKPPTACVCLGCGIDFIPKRQPAKYHSRGCANKHTASLRG